MHLCYSVACLSLGVCVFMNGAHILGVRDYNHSIPGDSSLNQLVLLLLHAIQCQIQTAIFRYSS